MDCPLDGTTLVMSDRQGVEIDYCPKCRGVWLDRGELDKILERSATEFVSRDDDDDRDDRRRYDDRDRRPPYPDTGHHPKKKRKNFLSEIFEMGGD